MNTLLHPIALNETSYNVNLLHQVLDALGLPVDEEEVAERQAGRLRRARASGACDQRAIERI